MPRLQLRQRLIALGEDFDVLDDDGRKVYRVDGKLLRIRHTFVIEDPEGREVATITKKLIAVRNTVRVTRDGELLATIRKALIAPFRDSWSIDVEGGEELEAKGNILDHEYEVRRGDQRVASVSKSWFTIRDTYGIDVAPGEDVGLMLAIAVAIDEMAHEHEDDDKDG